MMIYIIGHFVILKNKTLNGIKKISEHFVYIHISNERNINKKRIEHKSFVFKILNASKRIYSK